MNRLVLGLSVGLVSLVVACGGNKSFESLCVDQVPPPAACNTACNPSSGAADASCPLGYHCSADGKCDTLCTPTGGQCGANYTCTDDGFCQAGDLSGDPPGPDANCPAVKFSPMPVTPSIQLLIDRSGSMLDNFADNGRGNDPPTDPNNPEKYQTVQDALVGTNGVVTQLQASVYFGATLFSGDPNTQMCPTLKNQGRALNNKDVLATLISNNRPFNNASTPTPQSIDSVVSDFKTNPPPAGSPPVIVLATDGLPNDCDNNPSQAQSVASAQNAFKQGIKLYILGVGSVPGAQQHFQDMANAGQGIQPGQPNAKAYMATDPTSMAAAFNEIIRGVVSCDLQLNGTVDQSDAANGSVTLNGNALTYGTDWTLDPNGMTIHLLANACNTLKTSTNPQVDATFSCGAVLF